MRRWFLAMCWVFPGLGGVVPASGLDFEYPWVTSAHFGVYDDRVSAGGEVLAPLFTGRDRLTYLNAYGSGEEGGRQYASVGFGYRELQDSGGILGLGVFYDHANLGDGMTFDRLGLSLEYLTHGFDFRMNGYISSDEEYVTGNLLGLGPLVAENFSIFQQLIVQGHEAYDGAEIEFGKRLALPESVPFWVEVYAGGYGYYAPSDRNQFGVTAGAEIGLTEHVSFEAAYYEDEELLGSNTYFGLRASFAVSSNGNGLRFGSVRQPSRHPNEMVRSRLVQPVRRQNRLMHTETAIDRERILGDVIFVNEGDAVGNGIGEAEGDGAGTAGNPFESLQDGADLAAARQRATGRTWTVYTQGIEGREYNEDVKITESTRFISSATPIEGRGGFVFGNGVRPVVDGGFQAARVDFVEITGYEIKDGGRTELPGATDRTALDNDFARGVGDGIYLEDVGEVVITENIVRDAENFGIAIVGGAGGTTHMTIEENIVENNEEHGLALFGERGWRGIGSIVGNRLAGNEGDGMHLEAPGGTFEGSIEDNRFLQNEDEGLQIDMLDSFEGDIVGNTANGNEGTGIQMDVPSVAGFSGSFSGNTANENSGEGIAIEGDAAFAGDLSGNRANRNGGRGFDVSADGGNWTADITDNTANGNTGDGMRFEFDDDFAETFSGNTANNNDDEGIQFEVEDDLRGVLANNTANGNADNGFDLEVGGQIDAASIGGNIASNNGGGGLVIAVGDKIDDGSRIEGNTANNNVGIGIELDVDGGGGDFEGSTFLDNTANGNGLAAGESGIVVNVDDFEDGSAMNGNMAIGNGDRGIDVAIGGNFTGDSISGNTASRNAGDGIRVVVGGAIENGAIDNNTANDNGDEGIQIDVEGGDFDGGSVSGNTANGNTETGIAVTIGTGGKVNDGSSFDGNTASNNGENGIVIDVDGGDGDFEGSTIDDNMVIGNGSAGSFSGLVLIADEFQDGSSIDGNTANGNSDHGIDVDLSGDIADGPNSISSNTASSNDGDGIHIRLEGKVDDGTAVDDNTANMNGDDGIDIALDADFEGSTINGNTANGNGGDGIVVDLDDNDFEDGSSFANNTTNDNGDDGVDSNVDEEAGITDSGNVQTGNADDARDDNGTDDLGDNVPDN